MTTVITLQDTKFFVKGINVSTSPARNSNPAFKFFWDLKPHEKQIVREWAMFTDTKLEDGSMK